MRELRTGEVDEFMKRLKVFFTGIPYDLSDDTERHYQAIFYKELYYLCVKTNYSSSSQ